MQRDGIKNAPASAPAPVPAHAHAPAVAQKKPSISSFSSPQIKVQNKKVCIVRPNDSYGLNMNLPSVNLPSVNLPSVNLPSVNLPSVNLPSVNLPSVNLPSVNLPSVNLPTANINAAIEYKQNVMKTLFISIVNVLLTNEGKVLFEKSTKVITPAIDLIGKEVIKGIKSNKGKLVEGVKELGKPMIDALRGLVGTIPLYGNAISLILAVTDVVKSVMKGTNLVTATVDNMVLIPLKSAMKPTHQALTHSIELKKEFKDIDNDFIKLMKMCNDEWVKVQNMERQGINTAMMLKNKTDFALQNATAAAVIGEDAKKAIQDQDKITWCSGGSGIKIRSIIENSKNRIKKTIKRFHSLSNVNRSHTKTKSRR
jgi:hypothetical protein